MKFFLIKTSDILMDNLEAELKLLGYQVGSLTHHSDEAAMIAELEKFKPDVVVIFNLGFLRTSKNQRATLEDYLAQSNARVCVWDAESPLHIFGAALVQRRLESGLPKFPLYLHVDSWFVKWYRENGHQSEYFPFAADRSLFDRRSTPQLEKEFSHDLSFVGRCYFSHQSESQRLDMEQALRNTVSTRAHEVWASHLVAYPEFQAELKKLKPEDLVENIFVHDFFQVENYWNYRGEIVDQFLKYLPSGPARQFVWEDLRASLDGSYSGWQLWLSLQWLVDLGLRIYGGETWNNFLPAYSRPAKRLDYEELFALFKYSKFTFCRTKMYFPAAAHERIFQIYACGGLPLTDYRPDAESLFEPGELLLYRSLDEAVDLYKFYLDRDSDRSKIIQKARERIFNLHTFKNRAETLVKLIEKYFDGGAA